MDLMRFVASRKTCCVIPDFQSIPTFAEVGVAGTDYKQWFGIMEPAKLPPAALGAGTQNSTTTGSADLCDSGVLS
jgi:tripartite-type tricarboxylate transporter receptor subunit TctC